MGGVRCLLVVVVAAAVVVVVVVVAVAVQVVTWCWSLIAAIDVEGGRGWSRVVVGSLTTYQRQHAHQLQPHRTSPDERRAVRNRATALAVGGGPGRRHVPVHGHGLILG